MDDKFKEPKSDTFIKKRLFMLLDQLIINLPEMKLTVFFV